MTDLISINKDTFVAPTEEITVDEARERIISALDNDDITFAWRAIAHLLKEDMCVNGNDTDIFSAFMMQAQSADINNNENVESFKGSFMVVNMKLTEEFYIDALAKEYVSLHNAMIK